MKPKTAIIIGAGPAGLTAAYELLKRTDIHPIVLEMSTYMGGISRTVDYKGNRMDIGGHRFFSKSDRVMNWWLQHIPVGTEAQGNVRLTYQQQTRELAVPKTNGNILSEQHRVMLVRPRKSRIYFLRQFFDYPIKLSADTLGKLGITRTVKIGFSYMRSVLFPIKKVENLEQFFINRFGRQLYKTFFQSYTEKVWGVPCDKISAAWGEQRIKGLSIRKTISHFLAQRVKSKNGHFSQKGTETSLIEQFLYPKFGPGQMWEEVARKVRAMGGEIITEFQVKELGVEDGKITSASGIAADGSSRTFEGDYFFSTMPIQELVSALKTEVPKDARYISDNLQYRDFITVGLLLDELKVREDNERTKKLISDNWIYIQEPDVLAGRLQIFNNWSPHMVADLNKVWLGVEYFCYENDDLWRKPDEEMTRFAVEELAKIDILEPQYVRDATVVRMPKTYPAYFGVYERFEELRRYLDTFENLFLVGRNGMHKYNNQDHSMLTAMTAVDNILAGQIDKTNIWAVNTEEEYHEQKGTAAATTAGK
ncbi:MAG TPA: NAD(P)/FAD-dependent oxidoreductase [Terriglobales bacterium]|nr:NAD(P)/FAD-dependent oxidoreductase [Terriglobales bacterium]